MFGMDLPDPREAGKRQMFKRFLRRDIAKAVLKVLTRSERELIEAVVEQHELLGIEEIEDLPSEEERAEVLRQLALAKVDGEFPAFWVRHFSDLENADDAAQYADADDFEAVKREWADSFDSDDATVDQLAEGLVRARFGVDLETFKNVVVEWDDDREGQALRDVVAAGVETAHGGIESTNDRLREMDLPEET